MRRSLARCSIVLFFLGFPGCTTTESPSPAVSVDADVGFTEMGSDATQTDPGSIVVTTWCDAARGGNPGQRGFANDFAAAHVGHRLFGPTGEWLASDATLVGLLRAEPTLDESLLEVYAGEFETVCAVSAVFEDSLETSVTISNGVATIIPGSTTPEIPEGTELVVVDLRQRQPTGGIERTVSVASATDLLFATQQVRRFMGFPEQSTEWTHYESSLSQIDVRLSAAGTTDLPLVFVTPPALTPESALWVAGLRLSGRASIVGYDVYSAVAESTWTGIDTQGLLWRSSVLSSDGVMWPDLIPADVSAHTQEEVSEALSQLSVLDAVVGNTSRPVMATYERGSHNADVESVELGLAEMNTGLLIVYGTLDWFYPYFDVVGRDLDDALYTALEEASSLEVNDRDGFANVLGRLMHDIYDGHGFVFNRAPNYPDGYLIIQLEQINGEAVVRTSDHEGINAGDTIIGVDGVDATEWYETTMSRISAATQGYRFVLASDILCQVHGSRELTLRDPTGRERTVIASPRPSADQWEVPWGGTFRPSGWLSDLGAEDIYYLNLNYWVTPYDSELLADITSTITEMDSSQSLIIDMRDYPDVDYYTLAGYFYPEAYSSPQFWFPRWTGPHIFEFVEESFGFSRIDALYTGRVALIVGNKTVSSGENFAQMLTPLENVVVVGQRSAGTNGTITSFWLPGLFQLYFTGMRLRNLDGSDFHTIGVVPDVVVEPTAADFAAGRDPELSAAVEALRVEE